MLLMIQYENFLFRVRIMLIMTLILTEITQLGVAMAADSAVTRTISLSGDRSITRVLTGVQKLHYIPKINAGISCWGQGNIGPLPMDIWLQDFILGRINEYNSLEDFARLLEQELRTVIPPLNEPTDRDLLYGTVGFHLAGISRYNDQNYPDFWHIHNGRSQRLEERGEGINPLLINANHDIPPNIMASLPENALQLTRNGDIQIYANLFDLLQGFFETVHTNIGVRFGLTQPLLSERCEWLKFQIEFISNLYKFSNLIPSIGGQIAILWIEKNGCHGHNIPPLKINVNTRR